MSKKVHVSTLTNEELKALITKTITKRGLSELKVELLMTSFGIIYALENSINAHEKECREIAINHIMYAIDEYVIKPTNRVRSFDSKWGATLIPC